ncbi:hypothetical protein K280104A7_16790 [Candidatus Bariatricus faecipullorum]
MSNYNEESEKMRVQLHENGYKEKDGSDYAKNKGHPISGNRIR